MSDSTDLNQVERSDDRLKLSKNDEFLFNEDDIMAELENDEIPRHIREARLNDIVMRAREQQFIQQNKNEIYKELAEDEFLTATTKNKKCVVHFFHADFRRCSIMHTHLQALSTKYLDVKFCKIDVEKAKFFVGKLSIQILPAVLCFVDGVLKNRIIGFDQMGNSDGFPTRMLEKIFWKNKFLKKPTDEQDSDDSQDEDNQKSRQKSSIYGKNDKNYDSDD